MIRGTTKTGFEFEVDDCALDDYELLEILADIDNGQSGKIPLMVRLLLGKEQTRLLKEHCTIDGRVSAVSMMNEIADILNSNESGKN